VDVTFRTRKLQREYERSAKAVKAYGADVGRKYILRINIIKHSGSIDELKRIPALRCHSLKGDRAEEWAIDLTGLQRLIFTLSGEQLSVVRIEEVSKHYGD